MHCSTVLFSALIFGVCPAVGAGCATTGAVTTADESPARAAPPTADPALGEAAKAPPPTRSPLQLRAGRRHFCLLRDNAVRCWGHGARGKLGDGTQADRAEAVPVVGLPDEGRVTKLALSDTMSCALYGRDGRVWCWGGYNRPAQRGYKPGRVYGLGDAVVDIAPGRDHLCALSRDGAVRCAGSNFSGQLAHGEVPFTGPGEVALSEKATAIFAQGDSTCARLTSGKLVCWGRHIVGLFGKDGTRCMQNAPRPKSPGCSPAPVEVTTTAAPVVAVRGRRWELCLRMAGGALSCVLRGKRYDDITTGLAAAELKEVALGPQLCALSRDGGVRCATKSATVCHAPGSGQRGCTRTIGDAAGPRWEQAFAPLEGVEDAASLAASQTDVCAVSAAGPVSCWDLSRWNRRRPQPKPRTVVWRAPAALKAEKTATLDRLARLRSSASKDLFDGAHWLAESAPANAYGRNAFEVAARLLHAGRWKEGLALAAQSAQNGSSYALRLAREGRCDVSARLTQIPEAWVFRALTDILRSCAKRLAPATARLLKRRLREGIGAATRDSQGVRRRLLLAELHGRRGERAAGGAAIRRALASGVRANDKQVIALAELGFSEALGPQLDRVLSALPKALARAEKPRPHTLGTDARPHYSVPRAVDSLSRLLPALAASGRVREAAAYAARGFQVIASQPMGALARARLQSQLVLAAAASSAGKARRTYRRQARRAAKWLAAARKKAGASPPKRLEYDLSATARELMRAQLATGHLERGMSTALRHLSDSDKRTYGVPALLTFGHLKAVFRLTDSLTNEHLKPLLMDPLMLAAALRGDCATVARAATRRPMYELAPDAVETIAAACPREAAAAARRADLSAALRRPGFAILRAMQGEWIGALQAVAGGYPGGRPKVWAHVSALWHLAGAPRPEELEGVVEAILDDR